LWVSRYLGAALDQPFGGADVGPAADDLRGEVSGGEQRGGMAGGRVPPTAGLLQKKIVSSLGSILADAQSSGAIGQNVVHSEAISNKRRRGAAEWLN
jgi:hypothetical protein